MSNLAVLSNRFKHFNVGDFLSAKIYSDVKGNRCDCGGSFISYESMKGYDIPCCNNCGENPNLYKIHARISDDANNKKTVVIRNSQDNKRLRDWVDVVTTLKRINQEINEGVFDYRRYSSAMSKKNLLFENYIKQKYIPYYERKSLIKGKEGISPGGLRKKKSLIKNHLEPYFKGIDINSINRVMIKKFKDSYVDKFRTRDLALGELKRILNYALEYEDIKTIPLFEPIPKAKQRKSVASISTIREVLPLVDDEYYYKLFKICETYPIRPCEVRCLRWKDINFRKRTITIQRHLSDGVEMDGRKSIDIDSESGKGSITFPLTDDVVMILKSVQRSINKDDLVFPSKRDREKFISHTVLPDHWSKACKKAGVEYFEPYEIKHAKAFEITTQTGNLKSTMDALGHTNINTTMRYLREETNLKEIFSR